MPLKHAPLFLVGLSGPELSAPEREAIKRLGLRHFIFFSRNLLERDQIRHLISEIKSLVPSGFLAIDQEGGPVARLKPPLFPSLKAPLELAQETFPEEAVRLEAQKCAQGLKEYGFNLNLAPVVDLADDKAPPFLRGRTFGKEPQEVLKLARLYLEVFQNQGLWCCAKHFPGLGGVQIDPHEKLPYQEKLKKEALLPFEGLARVGLPMIMTTHLVVKEFGPEPATFSSSLVSIIRKDWAFPGLILTDDLFMGAIRNQCSLQEAALKAFLAGHDLLLLCQEFDETIKVIEELEAAFREKPLQERLEESLRRQERLLSSQN